MRRVRLNPLPYPSAFAAVVLVQCPAWVTCRLCFTPTEREHCAPWFDSMGSAYAMAVQRNSPPRASGRASETKPQCVPGSTPGMATEE